MATLFPYGYTDPPTNQYPGTFAPSARKHSQRVKRHAEFVYHFDGTEATSDVIRLPFGGPTGKWKKGTEVVVEDSVFIVETDAATTLTLGAGDEDTAAASAAYENGDDYAVAHIASDADRYATSIDAGAVGRDAWGGGVAATIPHQLQEDCYLTVTMEAVTTPAAAGVLRIRVAYFANDQ